MPRKRHLALMTLQDDCVLHQVSGHCCDDRAFYSSGASIALRNNSCARVTRFCACVNASDVRHSSETLSSQARSADSSADWAASSSDLASSIAARLIRCSCLPQKRFSGNPSPAGDCFPEATSLIDRGHGVLEKRGPARARPTHSQISGAAPVSCGRSLPGRHAMQSESNRALLRY